MADADIAVIGALIGHRARAAMLAALLSGEATTASELARRARVSRSGASAHLRKLRDGGLIVEEARGRNRLYRLSSRELAEALESLARVAPARPANGLRESEASRALKRARTCYDHLAGRLGVSLTEALLARHVLQERDGTFVLAKKGTAWFEALGVDIHAARAQRRSFVRACLDWSERRPHLAGALGSELASTFFTRRWITRVPGNRAVAVTPSGSRWLANELGLRLD